MSSKSEDVYGGLPEVHHVGMIVTDLDRSIERLSRAFSFGPFWRLNRVNVPKATLADRTVTTEYSIGVAMVWMNNTLLELVAPLDGDSVIHTFLKDHGEGLHHLAFFVDGMADHIAHLEFVGLTRTAGNLSPGPGGVSWVYLEGDEANGAVIELMDRDETSEEFFEEIYETVCRR